MARSRSELTSSPSLRGALAVKISWMTFGSPATRRAIRSDARLSYGEADDILIDYKAAIAAGGDIAWRLVECSRLPRPPEAGQTRLHGPFEPIEFLEHGNERAQGI